MLPALLPVAVAVGMAASTLWSQVVCNCDPAQPESMQARQCSLCNEAERQSGDGVFFLKDANPRKPNRWLALPRSHSAGQHDLHTMPAAERTALWRAAIAKARELWGDEWGLAYNGPKVRTQCHGHIHIGKLLRGVETSSFIVVRDASEIPAPPFRGLWVHPAGKRLHVHVEDQITETVLLR